MAKTLLVMMLKQQLNITSLGLAAWVVGGGFFLLRGIRRDRQSATAAKTEQLIKVTTEEKKEKAKFQQKSFLSRFKVILGIICPGWKTVEAWYLIFLSALLIGRAFSDT